MKPEQQTIVKANLKVIPTPAASPLAQAVDVFLLDCEARNLTPRTRHYYNENLQPFVSYLAEQNITVLGAVTTTHLRSYIIHLQTETFTRGGEEKQRSGYTVHAAARALRAFFNFCVTEELLPDSPMRRVRMPKLPKDILPAFEPADVKAILEACSSMRDMAAIYVLLDTGCRASEFVALNVGDVNVKTGTVTIRAGKGKKDRVAFLGVKSRKAFGKYMLTRPEAKPEEPLWISSTTGERLTQDGLRMLLDRLGQRAGVNHCHPHTFRRTFCLWSLDAGMDLASLSRIMGHGDLQVILRYLNQQKKHLEKAHREHGAVDAML